MQPTYTPAQPLPRKPVVVFVATPCPACGDTASRITRTRPTGTIVVRDHHCQACGVQFTSRQNTATP